MVIAFDIVLTTLLLALAVWIVVGATTFTSVVVFMAYGLLLAIAWVQLFV